MLFACFFIVLLLPTSLPFVSVDRHVSYVQNTITGSFILIKGVRCSPISPIFLVYSRVMSRTLYLAPIFSYLLVPPLTNHVIGLPPNLFFCLSFFQILCFTAADILDIVRTYIHPNQPLPWWTTTYCLCGPATICDIDRWRHSPRINRPRIIQWLFYLNEGRLVVRYGYCAILRRTVLQKCCYSGWHVPRSYMLFINPKIPLEEGCWPLR